jgi:hypothetical protein
MNAVRVVHELERDPTPVRVACADDLELVESFLNPLPIAGLFRGLLDCSENFGSLRFILLQHLHELVVVLHADVIAIDEWAGSNEDIRMSAEKAPSWLRQISHFNSVSAAGRTNRNNGSAMKFVPVTTAQPSTAVAEVAQGTNFVKMCSAIGADWNTEHITTLSGL